MFYPVPGCLSTLTPLRSWVTDLASIPLRPALCSAAELETLIRVPESFHGELHVPNSSPDAGHSLLKKVCFTLPMDCPGSGEPRRLIEKEGHSQVSL